MFLTAQQAGANPVLKLNAPRGMGGIQDIQGIIVSVASTAIAAVLIAHIVKEHR